MIPGTQYISSPEYVLAMIGFGMALVTFALSVHRRGREQAMRIEAQFLEGVWESGDPRYVREIRDLRSVMAFVHGVKVFGVSYFLALPLVLASTMVPAETVVHVGSNVVCVRDLLSNCAVTLVVISTVWTGALYLVHRFTPERLGALNDDVVLLEYVGWWEQVNWNNVSLQVLLSAMLIVGLIALAVVWSVGHTDVWLAHPVP